MKRFTTLILAFSLITAPTYAIGNYTYTTVQTETYNSSSPVGKTVNYNGAIPQNNYYVNAGYYTPYPNQAYYPPQENAYEPPVYNAAVAEDAPIVASVPAASYSSVTVDTPQAYDKQVVTTETYRDERENIDKNIDRAGKITCILGGAALVGAFVTAIFSGI